MKFNKLHIFLLAFLWALKMRGCLVHFFEYWKSCDLKSFLWHPVKLLNVYDKIIYFPHFRNYITIKLITFFLFLGKAVPFVELTVAHASVLTILAISFERYYAICKPLKAGYICTKARASLICLLAWFIAAVFTRYVISNDIKLVVAAWDLAYY